VRLGSSISTVPAPVRTRAGQDGARARAPALHILARGLAADPLRLTARQRTASVEAGGELHPQPRASALDTRQPAAVERARLRLHQAALDRDACGRQFLEAGAVHLRKRIAHCRDDARHTRGDQRIGARTGLADVGAWLERHVGRRAFRALAGSLQGEDFGMRLACFCVETFANDVIAVRDHAADHRIGSRRVRAALGQAQGAGHHQVVGGGEGGSVHGSDSKPLPRDRLG
jgi:hypothetical protein